MIFALGSFVAHKRQESSLLSKNREDFSRAVRWLTGFAFLRAPNNVRGDTDQDICRLCAQAAEKADHVLQSCPALNQLRRESFGTFQMVPGGMEWEVSSLIKFLSDERVQALEEDEGVTSDAQSAPTWDSEEEDLR